MLPDARRAWLDAQDAGWGDPLQLHRPGRLAFRRSIGLERWWRRPSGLGRGGVTTGSSQPQRIAGLASEVPACRHQNRHQQLIIPRSWVAAETHGEPVTARSIMLPGWILRSGAMPCEVRVAAASLQVANHEGRHSSRMPKPLSYPRGRRSCWCWTRPQRLAALRWSIRSAGRS